MGFFVEPKSGAICIRHILTGQIPDQLEELQKLFTQLSQDGVCTFIELDGEGGHLAMRLQSRSEENKNTFQLLDLKSRTWVVKSDSIFQDGCAVLSPRGEVLASSVPGFIQFWQIQNNTILQKQYNIAFDFLSSASFMVFSPNAEQLAACGVSPAQNVALWPAAQDSASRTLCAGHLWDLSGENMILPCK